MRDSIWRELHLESREKLHHQRGEISIFSKREEILLVQCIDNAFRVGVDNSVGDDQGSAFISSPDAIHAEAARQASDGAEEALESLGKVM
jgi:hypothetical protein